MELEILPWEISVCQIASVAEADRTAEFFFLSRTDEEISLVCRTEDVPAGALRREDGWRGFRIRGVLDFSLIGILSRLTGVLAEQGVGVFALSTYNTDYILVRAADLDRALRALEAAGYTTAYQKK